MSLPIIFTQESGERVLVNWDAVAFIAPAAEDESKGSVIHFNAPASADAAAIDVQEALAVIERRLQSATRA